jgi:hypothetical protein
VRIGDRGNYTLDDCRQNVEEEGGMLAMEPAPKEKKQQKQLQESVKGPGEVAEVG